MPIHRDEFAERYPLRVRLLIAGVTVVVALSFFVFPRFFFERKVIIQEEQRFEEVLETIDIPLTQQLSDAPPPPSRPSIPVASDREDIAEDITIEATTLDEAFVFDWEAPPPPAQEEEEGPVIRFIPYDEPPVPIGGFEAIQRNVRYPAIAREAGIEGSVIIQAFINDKGIVTETVVLKGVANTGLDEAAMDAIRRTRFEPAKQRDRAVGVWMSIPVNFKLTEG